MSEKYFDDLIFVVEGDRWKYFPDENYPIYGTSKPVYIGTCLSGHLELGGHPLIAVSLFRPPL